MVSVIDISAPIYSVDVEQADGVPAEMQALYAKIQSADAVLLASPEHNGMVPAMLKNTIDWLSRVEPGKKWMIKPLALLATSPGGRGAQTALSALLDTAPRWGANVVGSFSLGKFQEGYDGTGGLVDADRLTELTQLLAKLDASVSGP